MAKETAAQRRTRISMLLAHYDATSRELRKLTKENDALKAQIRDEVPAGTYGEWTRSEGTPREITDQAAVKAKYAELGLQLPTKMTEPPVIVTPAAAK